MAPKYLKCMKYENWQGIFLDLAECFSNIPSRQVYWLVSFMRLYYPCTQHRPSFHFH